MKAEQRGAGGSAAALSAPLFPSERDPAAGMCCTNSQSDVSFTHTHRTHRTCLSKALTVSDALMAFTLQTCFYFFNLTFRNNIVKYEAAKLEKELAVRTPELLCGPQGDA